MDALHPPDGMQERNEGSRYRVVIVGGGAAGLQLATALGGRKGLAVTLIDRSRTHVWKPKLHEIAAGSMDPGSHEVGYLSHARRHRFTFRLGEMVGLDKRRREVHVAPHHDVQGDLVTPERAFPYDTLILAVGSQSNDFGVPGVAAHALRLESLGDAKDFNRKLTNACFRAQAQPVPHLPWQLQVVIVGAGATGVELAAEVRHSVLEILDSDCSARARFKVHLIEAAARILPALPPRLSEAATRELQEKGIEVLTSASVARVTERSVQLTDGRVLPAELTVWAAGIRAPSFLADLGLQTNRLNQVVTTETLQSTCDERVFAIGDCAACPSGSEEKASLPPRAQVAHQQAKFLLRNLSKIVRRQPLPAFRYRDFGSLVSLGTLSAIGNLMGALAGRNLSVAGSLARLMYVTMYKRHEMAIHGLPSTILETLARSISAKKGARIKLH